ncbi:hypothetical protein Pelo_13218 [Pelomyxa schiedti]|nr:hypothetical protein Pelo_13218 [Pelomyxa schiedti]
MTTSATTSTSNKAVQPPVSEMLPPAFLLPTNQGPVSPYKPKTRAQRWREKMERDAAALYQEAVDLPQHPPQRRQRPNTMYGSVANRPATMSMRVPPMPLLSQAQLPQFPQFMDKTVLVGSYLRYNSLPHELWELCHHCHKDKRNRNPPPIHFTKDRQARGRFLNTKYQTQNLPPYWGYLPFLAVTYVWRIPEARPLVNSLLISCTASYHTNTKARFF